MPFEKNISLFFKRVFEVYTISSRSFKAIARKFAEIDLFSRYSGHLDIYKSPF